MKKILYAFLFLPIFAMSQYTGLQFDQSGDYIVTGYNGISGSGSRTVQCWYKGTGTFDQMFFVDMGVTSGGAGARFSVKMNGSSNVARVEIGGGGLNGTVNIANNFWHQVTVVYDAAAATNKYKIYVDGVLDVQGDIGVALNTAATSANPVTIGIRTDLNASTDLFGSLDDVRIWSIPLSAAEITANYNQELCGVPTGLAAYYKMDEGISTSNNTAITSLIDEVNPSSVNTLFGFTLTGNTSNYLTHILALVDNTSSMTVSNCGNYTWAQNGATYNTTGTYTDTVSLYTGCDSVYTLNLTVTPIPPTTVSVATCTDYLWIQNGQTYPASGMYNDTLVSSAGCDSVVILDLTITPITPTVSTVNSCIDYTWAQNSVTYTSSGVYSDTMITSAGCDSIFTLNLTINQPSSSVVTVGACSDYVWVQNSVTYTTSGSYFDTIPNAAGCDSVVELVLTIGSSSTTSQTADACNSYLWSINNQTYTASGVYTDTIFTTTGCDSIFTLTLNLFTDQNVVTNNGDGTLTADVTGAAYQWIDCSDNSAIAGATDQTFTPTVNGSYAVIASTATCDDTSTCVTISNVGLEELSNKSFMVFPNPSTGLFKVESQESALIKTISILDLQGKILESISIEHVNAMIDLTKYESGVYYLVVNTESAQALMYRLVKQ